MRRHRSPLMLIALTFFAPSLAAQDRVEIARKAKAATVLVEVAGGFKHGSAFCVHESGLFLTNEHVVRGAAEVKLILHPGLTNQQIVKARVIRQDKLTDLALLRIHDKLDLTALPLGSSDDLVELAEVIALGFPFGKALAEKGEYPAVSVNQGRITALRLKKGELERIQMDAVVNPGNSGGPVLDGKGKVIGVTVSGVPGATVNFAIPVGHVHKFVATPELETIFPTIAFADRYKPAVFQVKTLTLVPTMDEYKIELILGGRSYPMTRDGDAYRAIAEALKQAPGPKNLRVTLTYPGGNVQGQLIDQAITVGKDDLKLSDIRSLRFAKETTAILGNGKIATGSLTGLDAVNVNVGTDSIKLNPAKALELTIHANAEETSVAYAVIVRKGGKELARLESTLPFRDVPSAPTLPNTGDTVKIGIAPPVLERDATTINLPSTVADVAVGGNGRFLILHFPKTRTLGIFDVSLARIVHTLNLSEDSARFAAGMNKLVVAYPNSNIFSRYDLTSFERDLVKPLEFKEKIQTLAIGSASRGPIFVGGPRGPGDDTSVYVTFLDMELHVLPTSIKDRHVIGYKYATCPVRASANGRVFTNWGHGSPSQVQAIVVDGPDAKIHANGETAGSIMPSHDGLTLLTSRGGFFTWQAKEIDGTKRSARTCSVPAHGYPYHLSMRVADSTRPGSDPGKGLTVHVMGDSRVIASLPHVSEVHDDLDHWGRSALTVDKRFHFIPDAKVIVVLPGSNDKLILHRFDMDAALNNANFDYLFVASTPPTSARKGELMTHVLNVKSKRGGVLCKLLNGPAGMTVSPTGQVAWQVSPTANAGEADVLIAVNDASKQEIFYSFKITIR